MRTVSLTRTSLRATSSSLWRVARLTVAPESATGSRIATGVSFPVRPTWTSMALTRVRACSAGVLERDGPAGELGGEAELVLESEVVDLHDHAVDLVLQLIPPVLPLATELQDLGEAAAATRRRVGTQPPRPHPLEGLPLTRHARIGGVGDGVQQDLEATPGHDPGIQALHGSGGDVPGVCKRVLSGLDAFLVDRLEPRAREVDLAPGLERRRGTRLVPQDEGDRSDGPGVGRHIVSPHAVAPCYRPHQPAGLVVKGDRQPVDLELGGVDDVLLPDDAEDTLLELPQLVLAVRVVEAEHLHPMDERGKLRRWSLPHPLGGAVGRHELGKAGLDIPQLTLESVVVPIGDVGTAEDVVEMLVVTDLPPQLRRPLLCGGARAHGSRRDRAVSGRGRG